MRDLANQRVTVMGLGRFGGGIAVSRWLAGQGAKVLVTDKEPPAKLADSIKQLAGLPIEFRLGEHRTEDFTAADFVVASPAVPPNNPYIVAARDAGVPVTTEIRLFIERCPARVTVGVTGTKGKSSTTAMIGAMLSQKYETWVGGNIGRSLLDDLPSITPDDIVVLELSSFMLEYLRPLNWSPNVAVVTMIAKDHVEWHGGEAKYVDAKKQLVANQKPDDFAILNETCPRAMEFARATAARVRLFGLQNRRPFEIALPGVHNQLNAQGAFEAAAALGITWEQAQAALHDFRPLPHRLEFVHESHGVKFYNDSIATIPEAAIAALESFPAKKVIQIVGGRQKDLPVSAMCAALVLRAKAVLCIGEKGPEISQLIGQSPMNAAPPVYDCGDLKTAMRVAKLIATPGDIVLLSTGCKSYDQYYNFEQRGDEFRALACG